MQKKSILKAISLMLICLAFLSFKAGATTHIITVSNFQFSPSTLPDVVVGDIIQWNWSNGTHTTTSTSVPEGAGTWDSPMTSGNATFQYMVTVAGTYNFKCTPHEAFGMIGSFTASAPLPVKLSEFKVSNDNNNALLKWTTASESNIDYFSVQKSKTGADFAEIGRVPAAGNSSTLKTYTFSDPIASSTDKYYYYTIAIVDKEGNKEFSPVALFKNEINISKLILSLSPNPINRSGHLMLRFNADKTSKMNVKVTGMDGKTVLETTLQAYEGINNGHLMFDNLAAGTYSVSFELNGTKEVYKILVK